MKTYFKTKKMKIGQIFILKISTTNQMSPMSFFEKKKIFKNKREKSLRQ